MMSYLRNYLISGLLVWIPIWVTFLVLRFLLDMLDKVSEMIPKQFQPDALIGFHIPGVGILIILLVIFFTGVIVANFLGRRLVALWDAMIGQIPLVRTIYMGVKQVVQTLFTPGGQSFRKVCLVQYPREEMWTLAFQTGDAITSSQLQTEDMINVFVPTTPNPTSGFLLMLPRKDVIELNMSVDQALKFVISLGVVRPVGL